MAEPDSREVNRMRQDAIRRSQEMHRRAGRNYSHYSQGGMKGDMPPLPESTASKPSDPVSGIIADIFGSPADSDKLLIAALLLLLIREGGDIRLILALGYILL